MHDSIYQPEEDSYFLAKVLQKELKKLIKTNPNPKLLEIGAGSGIQLQTAFKNGVKKQNMLSVDINIDAVKHCKSLGFNCIHSNLFSNPILKKEKFDLIIFNPPYLPASKYDKKPDTTGGKKGNETIIKFLKQAKTHLARNGKILLLTSSLTPEINFKKLGYDFEILAKKKFFFEELFVWGIKTSE